MSGRPGIVTDGPGHGWMRGHEDTYLKTVTVKMKGSKRVMVLSWAIIRDAGDKEIGRTESEMLDFQKEEVLEITFKLIFPIWIKAGAPFRVELRRK